MKISILGCGWLGLPLARKLTEAGHRVKGSTTTAGKLDTLSEYDIEPYLLELDPEISSPGCEPFWDSDLMILNIPPGRKKEKAVDYYPRQIEAVLEKLKVSPIERLIFVSSTSVYPDRPGVVDEEDAVPGKAGRNSGNMLLEAEQMLKDTDEIDTTIVRFGGLYGYDQHPVTHLAGRKKLEKGGAPVNLIHRDDCLAIIKLFIEKPVRRGIFNGVSDGHPPRKLYYREIAKIKDLDPPSFKRDEHKEYKVVSNRKLKNELDYTFKYPNPMNPDGPGVRRT